jgi:hypothetical protein
MRMQGTGTAADFSANMDFDLSRLQTELAQLVDLGALQLQGQGQARIRWQLDEQDRFLTSATARLKDLALATSPTSAWRETELTAGMEVAGRLAGTKVAQLDRAVLQLGAAGAGGTIDQLDIHLRESVALSDEQLSVNRLPVLVHCSGDARRWQTRLSPWIDLRDSSLVGSADIHANLTWSPPSLDLHSLQGLVQQQSLGPMTFNVQASYAGASDTVRLSSAKISTQGVEIETTGDIGSLHTRANADLSGKIHYDWPTITQLLVSRFGNGIRIDGRNSAPFAISGPLGVADAAPSTVPQSASDPFSWLRPLAAQAGLAWDKADVFGLPLEKGELTAELRGGVARIKPAELTVSGGRVRLAPEIVLTPAPAVLTHPNGKLIDHVRVTPAMTSSWLKFVAPAVAEATQTEGEVSLDLQSAKVPLQKPETGTAAGRLDIHSLRVVPGATARAVILLAEQIRALVERRPPPVELGRNPVLLQIAGQTVDFRMADGRVYHDGMTLEIGNVTVRTRGWVAFDESIGLVAYVPVKAEWFGGQAPAGLKDQTLQISITGTLSRPQIDPRAMQQLIALFAQNAARDLIEGQINKQLDRLFSR